MAYVFRQEESIGHNINRILTQEVKTALDTLQQPEPQTGESIHSIRKRIKKIRALFRLVRRELKQKDFQRQNHYYRAIGHLLAPLRDATVMIKTLDKLRDAQPAQVSDQVFARLYQALLKQQDQAASTFFNDPTQIGLVVTAFEQASQRVAGFAKLHKGFKAMAPNLKAIYRRARKQLKVALNEPGIEQLHELRKDIKTLWYHTRLLQPIWPGVFKAYEQEMGRLGELLGDDHDFGVLAQAIESDQFLLRTKPTKEVLLMGLQQQRAGLQAQIYPLANRLLAEKPGEFVRRFERPWKLWRTEANLKLVDPHQSA